MKKWIFYEKVTDYVRNEMNKADRKADKKRRVTIGFALTILQRRLASSPLAIHKSLCRRIKKLQDKLSNAITKNTIPSFNIEDEDSFLEEERDEIENIVNQETASDTQEELKKEIIILKQLKKDAEHLIQSKKDIKWNELSNALETSIIRKITW